MSDLDLNSKQWCELVFDGKNTEFGAFQMRQESTSRHNKAMIIVAILVVLIITLPALFRYIAPKKQEEVKMTEVTQLTKLPPPEVKNNDVIKKVDAPPPPPLKSSIKFTAPKIVKDEDADREDVKTQEEIISAKVAVSVADVKGNDDLFGTDIQDLKEIAIDTPQEEVQETVFQTVEQMPSFPGGMQALNKYLKDNLYVTRERFHLQTPEGAVTIHYDNEDATDITVTTKDAAGTVSSSSSRATAIGTVILSPEYLESLGA